MSSFSFIKDLFQLFKKEKLLDQEEPPDIIPHINTQSSEESFDSGGIENFELLSILDYSDENELPINLLQSTLPINNPQNSKNNIKKYIHIESQDYDYSKYAKHLQNIDSMKMKIKQRKPLCMKSSKTTTKNQPQVKLIQLPLNFSLNTYRNFVYEQGELESCTANAFCAAFRILQKIYNKYPGFEPSRLYFYYYERFLEGTVFEDVGAAIIDGENYVKRCGICSENLWPYDITKFTEHPPPNCTKQALNYKISNFNVLNIYSNNLIYNIKHLLYNKVPVLTAIYIYTSFMSAITANTGVVEIPDVNSEEKLGGHEVLITGYNDSTQMFTVLNSWGILWGSSGNCYIPYSYISNENLTVEFTTITL
jgi:C1A family cysteine protease